MSEQEPVIKAKEHYDAMVKVCVDYLNSLEKDSAVQHAMTMYINMHMFGIKQALEYVEPEVIQVQVESVPTEEGAPE